MKRGDKINAIKLRLFLTVQDGELIKKRLNFALVLQEKMEITKKVELEKAIISLLKDDVIKIDIKEYSIIDIDDIKKFQEAKKSLIGNAKHFVLFISPKIGTLTKEAREYSASPEVNLNAKAKAVVVPNLAARLVANFFIKTNKPPIIHKAFVNEKEALIWLRTIKLN